MGGCWKWGSSQAARQTIPLLNYLQKKHTPPYMGLIGGLNFLLPFFCHKSTSVDNSSAAFHKQYCIYKHLSLLLDTKRKVCLLLSWAPSSLGWIPYIMPDKSMPTWDLSEAISHVLNVLPTLQSE